MEGAAAECQAQGIAFLPLVVESLGGWDERAVQQVKKLTSALARNSGMARMEVTLGERQSPASQSYS